MISISLAALAIQCAGEAITKYRINKSERASLGFPRFYFRGIKASVEERDITIFVVTFS